MTHITIDHNTARQTLTSAIARAKTDGFQPSHIKRNTISDVMLGSHLTYRYILLTNLLAKATNGLANGLALQAGADLDGSFDSRSLCHKVVVGFDLDPNQLAGKLGCSNEPYLNKPARYPALTLENAVRRGGDRILLEKCIDILGGLQSAADAEQALVDAVYYTLRRPSLTAEAVTLKGNATLHTVLDQFAKNAVAESCEGESCAVITGLAFYLWGRGTRQNLEIKVHPSNQAGSSSNEVLDVDLFADGQLTYTAEVKDKVFNINDIVHAAQKCASAGLSVFSFVCGPRSPARVIRSEPMSNILRELGVYVYIYDIMTFFAAHACYAPPDMKAEEVWSFVDAAMTKARVKDTTRLHILGAARSAGLTL